MRIEGRRYRDEWLPNFYPSREVAPGQRLRLSRTGSTVVLTTQEDAQIDELFMDERLFKKLERTGHIVTRENARAVFDRLEEWQRNVYSGPSLHIVVLTKRCNLNCVYCHMNPEAVETGASAFDMRPETAREVARFALETPNPEIAFEFQGGEPFLNFAGLRFFVEEARRQNQSVGKALHFSVVSNLMVASDEQLAFCRDNGVSVSYTVNGPRDIHDAYRVSRNGTGSFERVMERVRAVRERFPGLISGTPLCVIDSGNVAQLERMIDFYYDAGFSGVALIRLKLLGNARASGLGLDADTFLEHYVRGLEHILNKNRLSGPPFTERMIPIAMAKIFGSRDVGYVDWRNPSGDFGGAITYDFDGHILPTDEARSMRSRFGLGNVRDVTYDELVRRNETFELMNLSLRDREPICRNCAYNPFCGVTPVVEYAQTGDPRPKPHESLECGLTLALLDWVFDKLLTHPLPLFRMLVRDDSTIATMLSAQPEPVEA
jgi:radical SAM protein with 4Fe4S-binding SPASM domain